MKRRRGGGPVDRLKAMATLCALLLSACSSGISLPPSATDTAEADAEATHRKAKLAEARAHLDEGRTHDARVALREVLERQDSTHARALWWATLRADAASDPSASAGQPSHPSALRVCVLQDGETAVTGHIDGTLRAWRLDTGDVTPLLGGLEGPVEALACGPDGSVAAGGDGPAILIWDDPVRGAKVRPRRLKTGGAAVRRLAFHPGLGVLAAALGDATVAHWAPSTGQELPRLRGHRGRMPGLAFSTDGRHLATWGDERAIRVRRWGHEDLPLKLIGHRAPIRAAAFLPSGRSLVSVDDGGKLFLWDVESGLTRPVKIGEHPGQSWAVAVHPDGSKVATADSDGTVRLWPVTGEPPQLMKGHVGPVRDLAFSSDGASLVSVGLGRGVRVWDGRTGEPRHIAPIVTSLPASADGWPICTLSWPNQAELRPALAAQPTVSVSLPGASDIVATRQGCAVLAAAGVHLLTPNGRSTLTHPGATAIAWAEGRLVVAIKDIDLGDHTGPATAIAPTPAGAAYGVPSGAVLLPGGRTLHISAHPSAVTKLVAGPADTLAASFAGGRVVVWHRPTGEELTTLTLNGRPIELRLTSAPTHRLIVRTELGDTATLNLTPLAQERCEMLESVWATLPLPLPPTAHPCRPPA